MPTTAFVSSVATLLTTLLDKRYTLGSQFYGPLHVVFVALLTWFGNLWFRGFSWISFVMILVVVLFLVSLWSFHKEITNLFTWGSSVRLLAPEDIQCFLQYAEANPESFPLSSKTEIAINEFTQSTNLVRPSHKVKCYFNDQKRHVKGSFHLEKTESLVLKQPQLQTEGVADVYSGVKLESLVINVHHPRKWSLMKTKADMQTQDSHPHAFSYFHDIKKHHYTECFNASKLILTHIDEVKVFLSYIANYPQYFPSLPCTEIKQLELVSFSGKPRVSSYLEKKYGKQDQKIQDYICDLWKTPPIRQKGRIWDETNGVEGYYMLVEKIIGDTTHVHVVIETKPLEKHSSKTTVHYFEHIKTVMQKLYSSKKILWHSRWFVHHPHIRRISTHNIRGDWSHAIMDIEDHTNKRDRIFDFFFHTQKDIFLRNFSTLRDNPSEWISIGQIPHINLIFHGQPGMGKSSCVRRLALFMRRSLVCLNLKSMTRQEVFNAFYHPPLGPGIYGQPSDVLFCFEEFDCAVEYLFHRSKAAQARLESYSRLVKKIQKPLGFQVRQEDEDEDDESSDEITCNKRPRKKRKINSNVDSQELPELPEPDYYMSLDDLLDLFEGPATPEGLICIATTNHLEKIQKMCPALVRPGRLTPMYFGHCNGKIIREITIKVFNRSDVPWTDDWECNMCNARIMELAQTLQHRPDGFQEFCSQVARG